MTRKVFFVDNTDGCRDKFSPIIFSLSKSFFKRGLNSALFTYFRLNYRDQYLYFKMRVQ